MHYLRRSGSYEALGDAWVEYRKYLLSVSDRMPAQVFEFASALWHYDPTDHRSLHDSWVESVAVAESERDGRREVTIDVELLAPYHDGKTTLTYSDVLQYSLGNGSDASGSHGDWLIDEIRITERGNVVHEILFASGAVWLIECRTMAHRTTAPPTKS